MTENKDFQELNMHNLSLSGEIGKDYYLVYKDENEFIRVEAETAADALKQSGIENPYKVVHVVKTLDRIFNDHGQMSHSKPETQDEKKES